MKKILYVIVTTVIISSSLTAQDFLGYINGNYAGVTGLDLQPAGVVDSRYKVDVCLTGTSLVFFNNYVGVDKKLFKNLETAANDPLFFEHYLKTTKNNKTKGIYFANQIYMPSFLISLNRKNAIALKGKVRTTLNVDGISQEFADIIYNNLVYPALYGVKLQNKVLNMQLMSWAEYGLTYGRVLKMEGQHFLKAGATVKVIQGLQAAYLHARDLGFELSADTILSISKGSVTFGNSNPTNLKFDPSFGLDIGIVYEWRPKFEEYKYDMDGKTGLYRKDKNKYRLRLGISATDIGKMKFTQADNYDVTINAYTADINKFDVKNLGDFNDTLSKVFQVKKETKNLYVNLPTALSLQVDLNIWKGFYFNFTPYWALQFKNKKAKIHDIPTFSIAPRWEHQWFGVYVPLAYDLMGNTKAGVALRIGPLIVGSNSFGPWVTKQNIYGFDFYFMLKAPIMYGKIKDRDNDKVSNRKDKCKDVPGVWEFRGCPDKDGDHVQDKEDVCPDEPGLVKFNGCPDRDADDIIDKQDECPDEAGLIEFNGCPDKDGDKVVDKNDECPDEIGLAELKGCPDKDGDGLTDKKDRCPDKKGPATNEGCPEVKLIVTNAEGKIIRIAIRDKDGNFIFQELPADEFMLYKLEGEDTDSVATIKIIIAGTTKTAKRSTDNFFVIDVPKLEKIEPKLINTVEESQDIVIQLTKKEEEVLKKAFSNLEFAAAKDVIKAESLPSLDELAELMKKQPKWRLKLSGHTDNQGNAATNMKLSQKRSEAIKKYLVGKGIAEDRFKVEWFGHTRPIADNKTPAGRQKNRRVEMLIIE